MKRARSYTYQYKIQEIPVGIGDYDVEDNLYEQIPEPIIELNEKIVHRIISIAKQHLTAKQLQLVELMLQGNTQQEIAKMLNLTQTSIWHSIHGNPSSPDRSDKVKFHGGMKNAIMRLILKDELTRQLIKQLYELTDYAIALNITRAFFKKHIYWEQWLNGSITYENHNTFFVNGELKDQRNFLDL